MKIPRQYEPDKEEAFGNESWAKKFIYPNGWTMDSYKKVVLKVRRRRKKETKN
jgi:hypothetical protein